MTDIDHTCDANPRGADEELEQTIAALERDMARSEEERMKAVDELRSFISLTSHELQAPLRTLHGFTTFLARDYEAILDETGREYLDFIVQGTDRMQALIQGLVELSRVTALDVAKDAVSLDHLVDKVDAYVGGRMATAGVVLTRDELPVVWGDSEQITRLLQHLVTNAVTHAEGAEPHVHVSAEVKGNRCTITVADDGPGIPEAQREEVFQPFRRLHARHGQPGLGLTICRRIVERHGGRIWFEPNPETGSAFRFTLELAR